MDGQEYSNACELIGIPRPRGIQEGVPFFTVALDTEQQDLADKLWAAIDKPSSDPAVIALRDALGSGSPEWAALIEYKKEIVEQERSQIYSLRVIGMVVDFLFKACSVVDIDGNNCLVIDVAEMDKIKALRDAIESEVPY